MNDIPIVPTSLTKSAFLKAHIALLRQAATICGLETTDMTHPLNQRLKLSQQLLQQDGVVRYPEDKDKLPELSSLMIDSAVLSTISGGSIQEISLGNFEAYSHPKVKRRLIAELGDRDKFSDVMTELSCSAWAKTRGLHSSVPTEDGKADMLIYEAQTPLLTIECKNISSINRLETALRKANKQIKYTSPHLPGVAIINISQLVRPIYTRQISDDQPNEVVQVGALVKRFLKNQNRSLSEVLVTWDDHATLYYPPRPNKPSQIVARRCVAFFEHNEPRVPLTSKIFREYGFTIAYLLRSTPSVARDTES